MKHDLSATMQISSPAASGKLTPIAAAIGFMLMSAGVAHAEQAAATAPATTAPAAVAAEPEIQTVIVKGVAGSIESSLNQKRRAINFVEAITAEDIGKFPDMNLSESLQRVPGVTLDRNNVGDGSAINLRGLGPQFTVVTINGMEGVSSGTDGHYGNSNGSRGFNFEILPSELFTNAQVNKSVGANQVEGGLAGVVELQTPRPLDSKGFKFNASTKANYSDKSGEWDPRGMVSFSKNWDNVFGISFAFTGADTRYRSDSTQGGSYRAFSAVNTGTRASDAIRSAVIANGPRYVYYDDTRKTFGMTTTAQWRVSRELEITADLLYGKLKSDRIVNRDDAATESGLNAPLSATIVDGLITSGQFTGVQQRVGTNYLTTDEYTGQFGVGAVWRPFDTSWTIKPFVGLSKRSADRTWDLYSFRLANNGVFDPGVVSYNIRGDQLDFSSTATDFSTNPQSFLFNVFQMRPSKDTDTQKSAKLDFEKQFDVGSLITGLKFGARLNDHEKDTRLSQYRYNRTTGASTTTPPSLGSVFGTADFNVDGAGASVPGSLLFADPSKVASVFFPNGVPVTGITRADLTAYGAQQTYNIKEKTENAYLQGSFEYGSANLETGMRYVHTEQTSSGFTVANANLATQRITPISVTSAYDAWLPSANLRYELTPKVLLRAAFARTLTRPDLGQMAPSETVAGIDTSGGTGTRGNPNLKPYRANNYDLGVEWYPAKSSMVGLAIFKKDIGGFIDTQTFTETRSYPRQADGVIVTGPIVFSQPVNGVSAKVDGAEFTLQSRFTFLPYAWMRNFGGVFNYTYTKSSANFGVANDVRSSGLPGLSKNSSNTSIYYDDGKFEGRISYAWRSKYLAQFSDDFGIPRFRMDYGQVDLSTSYNINKNLSVSLDVINLTKSQFKDKSTAAYYPYSVIDLDRRIVVGARYSF
jgi:iron complex outermembrane receptor protein